MSDPLRDAVSAAGEELAAADAARAKALEHLTAALQAAEGEVGVRELARLSGVTRVTVYRLLEKSRTSD